MKFFANESTTVGLWHFEETSGSTHSDGSGNGYTLTDVSAPTRITMADFGGGLSFDGSANYTERNGGGANLEAANITVELLIRKPSPHTGDYDYLVAYSPAGAAYDGRGWAVAIDASGIFRLRVGNGTNFTEVADSVPFPLDRWIYCAATYDGANARLYRCGTLVGGPTAAAAISYDASPGAGLGTYKTFVLGANQNNSAIYDLFAQYELADLRVSNIAKSDAVIAAEQLAQEFCEVEPKVTEIAYGTDASFPRGPYHRYKTIRAQVEMLNNLVLGP